MPYMNGKGPFNRGPRGFGRRGPCGAGLFDPQAGNGRGGLGLRAASPDEAGAAQAQMVDASDENARLKARVAELEDRLLRLEESRKGV